MRTRWLPESWAVLGATRTSGSSPGGSSISGWGTSKVIGPVISTPAGQLARVLELGEGPDQRQVGADAAVEALDRRQARARSRCRLRSRRPCSRPMFSARCPGSPDASPDRRARRLQADREERQARLDHRVDVGDQGRQRHPGLLGRQRRRQGEDVADDGVRAASPPAAAAAPGPPRPRGRRRPSRDPAAGTSGIPRPRRSRARRPRPPRGAPPRSRRTTSWPRPRSARPSAIAGKT